jgi:hypothetical protein
MAITRAQQVRQMLKDGNVAIQGGVENYLGRQPEVQAPRKWQSGPNKPATELAYITEAEKKLLLKEDIHGSLKNGPNEGPAGIMSLDSFGDIGGGQSGADYDSDPGGTKSGAGTFGGGDAGESPADRKAREEKETARLNQLKEQQEKEAKKMQEAARKNRPSFLEGILNPRRKTLYNILPNNPKNELRYIQDLKFRNPTAYDMLPDNLKALYEETEEAANEFGSYKDFDKFSFEDFEDLRKFDPGDTGAMDFADYAATYGGSPGLKYSGNVGNLEKYVTGKDEFGRTMYGYREKTDDDGPDNTILFPQNTTPGDGDDSEDDDDTNTGGLNIRFRKDGGRINAMDGGMMSPEGGIMDLETGRQMYFLGKLVKKATRAVKKIAKSPIGKAAILGGLAYFGGGGALPKFLGGKGIGGFSAKTLFSKANPLLFTDGKLSMGKLALASAASPFLFGQEEEDEEEEFYRGPSLDIARIRNNPYDFRARRFAVEGGIMRAGYQEGSKEPVAKKTMPLLDMDGKEMDLRDDGGFVPLGRMERADDVPARLSKNEFVFTADAVRNAGEGDVDKGAEVMYNMMKNLESGGEVSEESQGLSGAREMFQTSKRLEEVL